MDIEFRALSGGFYCPEEKTLLEDAQILWPCGDRVSKVAAKRMKKRKSWFCPLCSRKVKVVKNDSFFQKVSQTLKSLGTPTKTFDKGASEMIEGLEVFGTGFREPGVFAEVSFRKNNDWLKVQLNQNEIGIYRDFYDDEKLLVELKENASLAKVFPQDLFKYDGKSLILENTEQTAESFENVAVFLRWLFSATNERECCKTMSQEELEEEIKMFIDIVNKQDEREHSRVRSKNITSNN